MLTGKKILLGLCGSIAAYKSAILVRLLIKEGAEVKVIMTKASQDFITPLTLSTLSKNETLTDLTDNGAVWNNHVELGLWADAFLIAPASANTLAKFTNGICDNLLTATYLSSRCPVLLAPAMDLDMWKHPATQKNIKILKQYGNEIIPVNAGELASGLFGEGRMAEPEEIIAYLKKQPGQKKNSQDKGTFYGKKILITTGPTIEPIDPVRFISNRSTGKMGISLAQKLSALGATVTLIKGPSSIETDFPNINVIPVSTADEMYEASVHIFKEADIAILAAAVSDYKPVRTLETKMKKTDATLNLELEKTKDILSYLGSKKRSDQILVGFALETDNEVENAKEKLRSKKLDLIVLNSLKDEGAGFGLHTNKITVINKDEQVTGYPLKNKEEVAEDIITELLKLING